MYFHLGLVLWEVATHAPPPMRNRIPFNVDDRILQSSMQSSMKTEPPTAAYSTLVVRCLDGDPLSRPSFESILTQLTQLLATINLKDSSSLSTSSNNTNITPSLDLANVKENNESIKPAEDEEASSSPNLNQPPNTSLPASPKREPKSKSTPSSSSSSPPSSSSSQLNNSNSCSICHKFWNHPNPLIFIITISNYNESVSFTAKDKLKLAVTIDNSSKIILKLLKLYLVGSTRKKKGFSIGKAKVLGSNEDQIEGEDGFPIKGPKLWERQIDFEIPEEVESVLAAAEEAEFELIGELSVKLHQNVVAKLKVNVGKAGEGK